MSSKVIPYGHLLFEPFRVWEEAFLPVQVSPGGVTPELIFLAFPLEAQILFNSRILA